MNKIYFTFKIYFDFRQWSTLYNRFYKAGAESSRRVTWHGC